MLPDLDHLRNWIGRTETSHDNATLAPLRALAATLDRDDVPERAGDAVPPLWHWLYFLPMARQSQLGADGHPQRGGFLPPVPLPRRMWAGSRLAFLAPLCAGQALRRESRIEDVRIKQGRSGALVFVQVLHEIHGEAALAIRETHDIVYRDVTPAPERAPAPAAAPGQAQWQRRIVPDPVLLFRYSALTFNGHRIHYDHPYATQVEGYPGLVVHDPLLATLLLDLLRRELPHAQVRQFAFRAVRPLFDTAPFLVCGAQQDEHTVRLWACSEDGQLAMDASAIID